MPKPIGLQPHRFALLFPPMSDEEFRNLAADIKANGLRTAITTIEEDGTLFVLEGVHRQRACFDLGIEPKYTPFQGGDDDALAFVLSANLHRRNMNPSQLAQLGADLADLPPGRPGKDATLHRSREAVAALLSVSVRSLAKASKVKKDGDPALVEAVKAGDVPVDTAAKLAEAPKAEQRKILAKAKSQPKPAAKKTIKAAAAKAQKKGKPVPKVKTAANGKATELAAPNAKAFKEAAAAFASSAEYLFSQKAIAIIEHPKLPAEQRNLVVNHLLHIIKRAKALHAKLEGTPDKAASSLTDAEPTDVPATQATAPKPNAKSKAERRAKP